MHYTTDDIRNIALVGHAGAGKTTLVEALLARSGTIANMGSIEKGSTVCDYEPEEKSSGHSFNTAIVGVDHQHVHINLLDTPGFPDFMGHTFRSITAVDSIALVIDAQVGIDATTIRMMDWAAGHGFCRMIAINKIDEDPAALQALLDSIRSSFGVQCIPINLPAAGGGAIIDCFSGTDGETAFMSVADVHTAIMDRIVEMDDAMMEPYLEGSALGADEVHAAFEKALRAGHLVPVCFVSALDGTGVTELLDVFERLMPNPHEGTVHPFLRNSGDSPDALIPTENAQGHVLAHVFKVEWDPFIGKMGVFRIHDGTVTRDSQLFVDDSGKPFRVGHLFRLHGKQHVEIERGVAGDICAVSRVDEVHIDAVLHDDDRDADLHAPVADLPPTLTGLALVPLSHGDEQKISAALEKLVEEDPCLQVEQNAETHETILRGLGDLHLRIALQRLKDRYNVEVESHPPSIAYRESITSQAEGHFRHKKQTGGAGQFAEVWLRIEPLPRDSGLEFVNAVVGGAIPASLVSGVEKGVRRAAREGVLAGYPVHDLRVTVYDGKTHSVDSNEVSFVTAARKAFVEAVEKARAILLEPVMNLQVNVPPQRMGDITGDLSARRARVIETRQGAHGSLVVEALAPLAELDDYHVRLKALTAGEGHFSMRFAQYEPAPPKIQQELVATRGQRATH